jgi:sugar phosphate isomerase/epimerase
VLGGGDAGADHQRLFPARHRNPSQGHLRQVSRQQTDPRPEKHKQASVYHNLGGGGVDFPAVFDVLRKKHFKGWAIFDVDGPRKGDDGYDAIGGNRELAVDDYLSHNINYLRDVLGVKLPPRST